MSEKAAKYQKIKDFVKEGILSRNFTDQIPSENQLAEKFEVSRMTARRALTELEREGSVLRISGKGTFVRQHRHYTSGFFRVRPFRKWAEDLGATLRTDLLKAETIEPSPAIAEMLKYDGFVIYLCKLNYLDEVPVRYSIRYLRADYCGGILFEDLSQESIHDILLNKYNLPMTKITQSMTAQGLNEELAGLFHEDPGFPVFFFQRLVFSHDYPITYVEYTMRGDMAFQDTFQPQLDSADYGRPGK